MSIGFAGAPQAEVEAAARTDPPLDGARRWPSPAWRAAWRNRGMRARSSVSDCRGCGLSNLQAGVGQKGKEHLRDLMRVYSPEELDRGKPDLGAGVQQKA